MAKCTINTTRPLTVRIAGQRVEMESGKVLTMDLDKNQQRDLRELGVEVTPERLKVAEKRKGGLKGTDGGE